jgi:hypothetical protein
VDRGASARTSYLTDDSLVYESPLVPSPIFPAFPASSPDHLSPEPGLSRFTVPLDHHQEQHALPSHYTLQTAQYPQANPWASSPAPSLSSYPVAQPVSYFVSPLHHHTGDIQPSQFPTSVVQQSDSSSLGQHQSHHCLTIPPSPSACWSTEKDTMPGCVDYMTGLLRIGTQPRRNSQQAVASSHKSEGGRTSEKQTNFIRQQDAAGDSTEDLLSKEVCDRTDDNSSTLAAYHVEGHHQATPSFRSSLHTPRHRQHRPNHGVNDVGRANGVNDEAENIRSEACEVIIGERRPFIPRPS